MEPAPLPHPPADPGDTQPRPRRRFRPIVSFFKIIAWLLAIVIVLLLGVFIFLQTTLGRDLVRDIVVDVLNDVLKGHIEVDRIGGLLPFSAEIEGFRVRDPDGQLVLSVAHVTADFHPLDLFDRTVHLSNVLIERPEVVLFDDKNRLALIEAFSPREPTPDTDDPPWLLAFEGIHLDKGTVERILPGTDSLSLSELSLDLTLGLGQTGLQWPHLALRAKALGTSPLNDLMGGDLSLTTRGGFEGSRVRVDTLDLTAGGHTVTASGFLDPAGDPGLAAGFTLSALRFDLERLPKVLRERLTIEGDLGPGRFEGAGKVALSAAGHMTLEVDASSPLALLNLTGSADLHLDQKQIVGDWAASLRLVDVALPREVAARLPAETRKTRIGLRLRADGTYLPPGRAGDGGRLHAELDVLERHDNGPPGRLQLIVDRTDQTEGADRDDDSATRGATPAPTYTARALVDEIGLQPWLQLAGEPDLIGALDHFYLEGKVLLPPGENPIVDALFASELSAYGKVNHLDPPRDVAADHLALSGSLSWQGQGLPELRLDLHGDALGFSPGSADKVALGFDLRDDDVKGGPELVGTLTATGVRYEDLFVGRLEVPLSLALGPTIESGQVPLGRIRWAARDVVYGKRRVASTDGDLTLTREGRGLRARGRVAHVGGVFAPDLSVGESAITVDLALAPSGDLPVGGPITGRIDGTVTRVRAGAYRVAAATLVDMKVDIPLGPRGLDGSLAAVGKVFTAGVEAPEGKAGRLNVDLDTRIDLRPMEATGRAALDASDVVVQAGGDKVQRLAKLHVDAVAQEGGRIAVSGVVTQPRKKGADPSLEARFKGELTLPSKQRVFAANLERLEVFRQGDLEATLSIGPTRFVDGGWIEVDSLAIRTQRRTGAITGKARFHPGDGALEVDLAMADLSLSRWAVFAREVLHWVDLDGPPPPALPQDLDGRVAMALSVRGTLASPRLELRLRGGDLRYGGAIRKDGETDTAGPPAGVKDGYFDILATLDAQGARLDASARWRGKSSFNVSGRAPLNISFSPPSIGLADDAQIALEVRAQEPHIADALSAIGALVPNSRMPKVDGSLDLVLRVEGTPRDPRLVTAVMIDDLDLASNWQGGRLTLEGTAQQDRSGFRLELTNADNARQGQIDIELPFALPRALRERDPVQWVKAQLDNRPFLFEVVAPPFVVGESPFADLVPLEFIDLAAEVDLRFGGTLIDPDVRGKVALRAPDSLPMAADFILDLDTSADGSLAARLAVTQADGASLVEGALNVPDLSELLRHPEHAAEVARDPRFTLDVHTSEIRSLDLWELRQSLGQLFAQLFPDGWLMLDVSARGTPEGLTAKTYVRIRTSAPAGQIGFAAADPNAPRRNAADDVRLVLSLGQDVSMNLVMTQDTRALTPSMGVSLSIGLSMEQLLSGTMPTFADLPITRGKIVGGELRLEGFAGVFKSVLGTSSGTLTGDLTISGTVGAPRFEGGLNAQFDRLVVAPLGLDHDNVTVFLSFEEGTRWRLDASEIYAEKLTARTSTNYCGVSPRVIGTLDLTKRPYLSVALNGDIPRLDPAVMTIGGCIGMKDYPVLATKSLAARIEGSLTLDGTVAQPAVRGELKVVDALLAPELASKSVRPIGLPLDVTLVRGDPVPPPERPARNPYKTGVLLDIAVSLPKGVVRVEPSLMQPYGEVRALLYPHGDLRVRTVDGELSLVGTIEVPKETVFLYGKTFTVDPDSRLVFTGDMPNDPQLFFTARYNIADVDLGSIGLTTTRDSEVVVRVTGTPTEPRLDFTSSPVMDETNILSVIALGVPAGGGEALGDAVQSQLLTAVMGMATLQFARDFQQRLALDILRIEARSADPTDTRLTVGKRLSEDLLLSYYLNLSAREGEDRNSGSLEYRLTRYLSLLARAGDAGDVGLEFNLRFADSPPTPRSAPRRRERADNRPRKDPELRPQVP